MSNNLSKDMELSSTVGSQEKKIIHFTSGETLEEDDSEEEEFVEQAHKYSFDKSDVTNLTWRAYSWFWARQIVLKSLQTCDFLGGKLAGLFGLSLAKYQYAVDEYDRNHKLKTEREETFLSDAKTTEYGATVDTTSAQTSPEKIQLAGLQNEGYN